MTDQELLSELTHEPVVQRPLESRASSYVIGGMGGSALAGEALRYFGVEQHVTLHRGYGLPHDAPEQALYVALSYSGNTEETISFASEAKRLGRSLAIITSGGTLASFATRENLPLVLVPPGLVPRYALIYLVRALLALVGEEERGNELAALTLDTETITSEAERDAHALLQTLPLLYTSPANTMLGHIGKIVLNETAHTPAFSNTFSEVNHAEMQAFDVDMPQGIEHLFCFVLITDESDDERILRRMDIFESLMAERGRLTHRIHYTGVSRSEELVSIWLRFLKLGGSLAETRGIDPEASPLIAAFKKLL